jgi:hypothetical protein
MVAMPGRSNARTAEQRAQAWAEYQRKIAEHGRVEPVAGQEYKGSQIPMLFRCLLHDQVLPGRPLRLAEGRGLDCCRSMGSTKKKEQYAASYADELKKLGLKVRLADGATYQGNHVPVDHYCLIHQEVHPATPANVKQGHGLTCCKTGGVAKRQAEREAMAAKRGIPLEQLVVGEGKSAGYCSLDQVPAEWLQLPGSRKEAIVAGELYCFTGKPCAHGHYALRYCNPKQRGGVCSACRNHHAHRWADENPELISQRMADYYAESRDLIKAKMRVWHQANRDRNNAVSRAWRRRFTEKHGCDPMTHKARLDPAVAEQLRIKSKLQSRRWRAANPEEARAAARKGTAAWRRRNPEKVAASNVFRNRHYWGAFRNLTPQEQRQMVAIYKVRDKINGATHLSAGQRIAEVDHLLPLVQGGAHHPANLLVVATAANRFWGGRVKACPWPQPADWMEPEWEITAADANAHT